MHFFIFKSEIVRTVFITLICWGIRWLCTHLGASNDAIANRELEEEEDTSRISVMPMDRKVGHKAPQVTPLAEVVAANPQPSPRISTVAVDRKASFSSKRKLFRNALLMDALMQRKYFIT